MWTDYLLLFLAAICIGFQFSLTKVYQIRHSVGGASTFFFSAVIALCSFILFFCLNKFSLQFGLNSVLIACGLALVLTVNNAMSIIVVNYGEVSVYTMFMMLGGMLLPYAFGIAFLSEKPSISSIIGIFILVGAMVMTAFNGEKAKNKILFTVLCVAVFCLNGAVSIFSKLSRTVEGALPIFDFMIWDYMFSFIFSVAVMSVLCVLEKRKGLNGNRLIRYSSKRSMAVGILSILGVTVVGSAGYLCQLIGAENLNAVVLYPIVSGGTIIITAVLSRIFFKEAITLKKFISLCLTLLGTVLFLF